MSPELGRSAFRIAILIAGASALLLPFQERNSAEFWVTLLSLGIGLAFIGVIAYVVRRFSR